MSQDSSYCARPDHLYHKEILRVINYYTQLKSLWDELDLYRSSPSCSCGALKLLQSYHEEKKTWQFLMDLDDKFPLFEINYF